MNLSETPATPPTPDPGLPTVKPLTAGYIVQLFLVPGLIVVGLVGVLMVVNYFNPFQATPEQFLKKLDDPNPEVRWRAAADLADVLLRNDVFASDANLALGIAERLRQARDRAAPEEQALAARLSQLSSDEQAAEAKARDADRVYIKYLAGCLSLFRLPVGLSQLKEMAEDKDVAHPEDLVRRRVAALTFLAQLGDQVQKFESLKPERQLEALAILDEEAQGSGDRAKWAADALKVLRGAHQNQPTILGVDEVCARLADDPEADVRKLVAYALRFWNGSEKENQSAEDTLFRLTQEQPAGSDVSPTYQVRYNAAVSLALRHSDRTPVPVLVEMLDEPHLQRTFRVKSPQNGQEAADMLAVQVTMLNALQALEQLRQHNRGLDLSAAVPAVQQLTGHPESRIQAQARKTLASLQGATT